MADQDNQHHTRFDPIFHFLILPLCLFLVGLAVYGVVKHPSGAWWTLLFLAIAATLIAVKTRVYALHNQDRIIRMEQQLRLYRLMPNEPTLIDSVTIDQLIGLRFASDAEAPELARRAVRENLTRKQIKAAVQHWRADHHRI